MLRILCIITVLSVANADEYIANYLNINKVIELAHTILNHDDTLAGLSELRQKIVDLSVTEDKASAYFKPKLGKYLRTLLKTTLILAEDRKNNANSTFKTTVFQYINSQDAQFKRVVDDLRSININEHLCSLSVLHLPISANLQTSPIDSHLPYAFEGIVHEMRHLKTLSHRCDANATIPDQIIALYNVMASLERKRFLMSAFTYKAKLRCTGANVSDKMAEIEETMIHRTQQFLRSTKLSVAYVPRDLYVCKPIESRRSQIKNPDGTTSPSFIELEGYQRTVLINEEDRMASKSCQSTCEDFTDVRHVDHNDLMQRSRYCPGRLLNCKSAGKVETCMQITNNSIPRYQWMKDANGNEYGKMDLCRGRKDTKDVPASIWYPTCDNCICSCIDDAEPGPTRYAISLRPELSNGSRNEVVTSMKFVMVDRTIYPQIQTGKLLPEGNIESSSVRWKPVNCLQGVLYKERRFSPLDFARFGTGSEDISSINLENVYAEDGYVVTGIKFIRLSNIWDKHETVGIGIDVHTTSYDFATGKLWQEGTQWVDAAASSDPSDSEIDENIPGYIGTPLLLHEPDSPFGTTLNLPDSKNGQFIRFQASNLKKDAGQSTVPFFDARPVGATPPTPLAGIGMIHTGTLGSGGLLAFKTMSLDYSKYINTVDLHHQTQNGVHLSVIHHSNVNNGDSEEFITT